MVYQKYMRKHSAGRLMHLEAEIFKEILKGEDITPEMVNSYIGRMKNGEIEMIFDDQKLRAIALVFQLVIDENLDPMDIDLVKFTKLYMEKVREEKIMDFISAGRLIFMAWNVLFMKSENVLKKFSGKDDDFYDLWDPYEIEPGFDENFELTESIMGNDPILEPVRHGEKRPITLPELLSAVRDALNESMERKREIEKRKELEEKYRIAVNERMHKESIEEDIKEVWNRICEMEDEFLKKEIEDGTKEDSIRVLLSLLFLEKDDKVRMYQEKPFSDIHVHVMVPKELRKIEFLNKPTVEVVKKS